MDKAKLRKEMIQTRLDLSSEIYTVKSNLIISKLKNHPDFINAKTIGIYVSFKNEVNTTNLIEEMVKIKKICVPKTKNHKMDFYLIDSLEELKSGTYGILEPHNNRLINKNKIDLLIVPIVAYDKNHNRLGYGGGYYDRYLKDYCGNVIGLAFNFQQVEKLPVEKFDLPIKIIIDEK
ncbi:5-formyltetrahydrofolate cyclo-ligase [Thomasclavelia cocleata]|uniref:5-formyltetrahydrofolate cyclo-ligase n=2 Tax=Thomasclavelia cocleata TaxID=69824 RepID=UPI00242C0FF7|nr:5-formyltetrahydrofolate cyclo-ligase [Thomasclavelia cocleata]